jgi:hypothetical protein
MGILEARLPQHLSLRRSGLRRIGATSVAITATGLLIEPLIITIIVFRPHRGIIGNGGGCWCRGDSNRSSREFGADHLLIWRLLFFIRVIKDYDLTVTRQPEDAAVEVGKKFLDELRITRSVSEEVFLIWR